MRRTMLTAATVALMMAASMMVAQPGPRGPGGPGNGGPNQSGVPAGAGMIEYLGLDEAQVEAWTAYHDAFREAVAPLHEAKQALHVQLREALDADTPDSSVIGQLMVDIQAIRAEVFSVREALDVNLKSILTAEQIVKFDAYRAAQGHMRRGGGGPGGGQGRGMGPGNGNGPGDGSGPGNGPCS